MLKKTIIIYTLLLIAISYFAFTVFIQREKDVFTSSDTTSSNQENLNIQENQQNAPIQSDQITEEENEKSIKTSPEQVMPLSGNPAIEDANSYIEIAPLDCTQECMPYEDNDEDFEYCKNVCGLIQETPSTDCDSLKRLKKDYCLKNESILKKDRSICDQIIDGNLKRSCKNRNQEDVLENM